MSYLGSIATATKSTTKRGATQSNSSIVDKMVHTLNSVGSKGISSTLNNVLAGSSAGALASRHSFLRRTKVRTAIGQRTGRIVTLNLGPGPSKELIP